MAALERADARTDHCISLSGLAPDIAEIIGLTFEIMGWRVVDDAPARLAFVQGDGVVQVVPDCAALAGRMARLGLDRLVQPVSVAALERLMVVAG